MSVQVWFDGLASEPRLDHAEGVAVAADGTVWCGGEQGQIYRIVDGVIEQVASTGGFCLGVAVGHRGEVYVCDLKHAAVFALDPGTCRLDRFSEGFGGRRFVTPNAIAIDARGDLYVSDSGVAGEPCVGLARVGAVGGDGEVWWDGALNFANGLALAADGSELYVVETWARRVVAFGVDGASGACVGAPRVVVDLPGTVPDGVAVDARGDLWVACYEPSQVLVVEGVAAGAPSVRVAAADPDAHLLCHPTNLAFRGETAIVANLGRWHLTAIEAGVGGVPTPASPLTA